MPLPRQALLVLVVAATCSCSDGRTRSADADVSASPSAVEFHRGGRLLWDRDLMSDLSAQVLVVDGGYTRGPPPPYVLAPSELVQLGPDVVAVTLALKGMNSGDHNPTGAGQTFIAGISVGSGALRWAVRFDGHTALPSTRADTRGALHQFLYDEAGRYRRHVSVDVHGNLRFNVRPDEALGHLSVIAGDVLLGQCCGPNDNGGDLQRLMALSVFDGSTVAVGPPALTPVVRDGLIVQIVPYAVADGGLDWHLETYQAPALTTVASTQVARLRDWVCLPTRRGILAYLDEDYAEDQHAEAASGVPRAARA